MNKLYRIRILHISDLHERVALDWMNEDRKAMIRLQNPQRFHVLGPKFLEILEKISGEHPIDLICFTGDVADFGLPEEYSLATNRINAILTACNIAPDRFFPVPGNHDINRETNEKEWKQLRKMAAEVPTALSDWLGGRNPPKGWKKSSRDAVLKRSQSFWQWLSEDMGLGSLAPQRSPHGRLGYRATVSLPRSLPFAIHLIGLDSAWLAGDDHDAKKLMVTAGQVDLLTTVESGELLPGFRLALIHHPLAELSDQMEIERRLAERVDLVLHGHQHDPVAEEKRDLDRSCHVLAAGSLFEGQKGEKYLNGFNLIDAYLDNQGAPLCFDLTFYSWTTRGYWHKSGAIYKAAEGGTAHWVTPLGEKVLPDQAIDPEDEPPMLATKGKIHEKVKSEARQILSDATLETLQPLLVARMARYGEEKSLPVPSTFSVDALVETIPLLDALQLVHEAVEQWHRQSLRPRGESFSKSRRDLLTELAGWLSLLAVSDEFLEAGYQRKNQNGDTIDLAIPVVHEATVEIVLSRLTPRSATMRLIRSTELGAQGILCLDHLPEPGPNPGDFVALIQQELFQLLYRIRKKEIDETDTKRVREKIKYRRKRGEPLYLLLGRGKYAGEAFKAALAEVKSLFPALVFASQDGTGDLPVLNVDEYALIARLEDFYQLLFSDGDA